MCLDLVQLTFAHIPPQNHWFTYNETMTVESVTQAVSNLALQFGEEDADPGAMVSRLALPTPTHQILFHVILFNGVQVNKHNLYSSVDLLPLCCHLCRVDHLV